MKSYAFFNTHFVPFAQAKIGVMTQAFNYGTACYEGIRVYWLEGGRRFCLFRATEHYERLRANSRILYIEIPYNPEELLKITMRLVAMNPFQEDVYVRPIAYKKSEILGVRLHGLEDGFLIFAAPFGSYLDTKAGIRCCVSSWRRLDDDMIPPRGKIAGSYVNSALAKTEAVLNGFDEALMLTKDGCVSEGSTENIFLVMDSKLVTPPVHESILVGITRATIMELAEKELGIETVERRIARSELYVAEECFLTGTAGEIAPVVEIDRRKVGSGTIGPLTAKLQKLYADVSRGRIDKYHHWCTFVPPA